MTDPVKDGPYAVTPELRTVSVKQMANLLRLGAENQRPRAKSWDTIDYEADANFIVHAIQNIDRTESNLTAALDRVGELTGALERARCVLANYGDPTGYTDANGEQFATDEEVHHGLLALDAVAEIDAALRARPS